MTDKLPELVGITEIARMTGQSRQLVGQWKNGRHGEKQPFPEPVARLAQGDVWRRDQVEAWLKARQERLRERRRDS